MSGLNEGISGVAAPPTPTVTVLGGNGASGTPGRDAEGRAADGGAGTPAQQGKVNGAWTCTTAAGVGVAGSPGAAGGTGSNGAAGSSAPALNFDFDEISGVFTVVVAGGNG